MEIRCKPQSKAGAAGPISKGRLSRSVMPRIRHMLAAYLCYLGIAALSCSGSGGAMAQRGFVSVDCGAPAGTYTDTNTSIEWISDVNQAANFAKGVQGDGLSMTAAVERQPPAGNHSESFRTLRYFPSEMLSKYCYIFSGDEFDFIQSGTALLVRASFWAGDLTLLAADRQSGVPSSVTFQLLLNADIWDDVTVTLPQQEVVTKEVYAFPFNSTLPASVSVCLASGSKLGMGIPFISSLELRVMPAEIQDWLLRYYKLPLHSIHAIDYGASPGQGVTRYPDDLMDRIWQPDTLHIPTESTTRAVPTESSSSRPMPPAKVMRTAYVEDEQIVLVFDVPVGVYYVALYLFEVSAAAMGQSERVFIWQTTGFGPNAPLDMYNGTFNYWLLYSGTTAPLRPDNGQLTFTISKAPNSTEGPLVNALLLFREFRSVSPGSNTQDVNIIKYIQTEYSSTLRASIGDPCLPYPYNWLNCTLDQSFPRISNLFLSNKSLDGGFPPRVASLESLVGIYLDHNNLSGSIPNLNGLDNLQILDLSNNQFSGQIPTSLADLPSLTTLILDNNNLVGDIPSSILQKFGSPDLVFSFSGNPLLCNGSNCTPKPKPSSSQIALKTTIPIAIISIVSIFVAIFFWQRKKQKKTVLSHVKNLRECSCFTYNQIKTITNDFEQKLGEGGFGPVYYGALPNGTPVAVKVLAKTSRQGEREFLNEVEFLSRIHHRSLVALLGYCVEEQLVLVYENMTNGSLYEAIEGKCLLLNTWQAYLRVAVDAAEGLEYLHYGSDPEIIHRDVKSSNILVSRDMQGKISDFGISRSKTATGDAVHRFTFVQGSLGYIDPEYAEYKEVTNKIDVYAFGVVLLEICSGRHVFIQKADKDPEHIVNWVKQRIEQGNIHEIMNPRFNGCYSMSAAWKVIDVAVRCVESESRKRPNMREVCMELRSALSMELEGEPAPNSTFLITADISAR